MTVWDGTGQVAPMVTTMDMVQLPDGTYVNRQQYNAMQAGNQTVGMADPNPNPLAGETPEQKARRIREQGSQPVSGGATPIRLDGNPASQPVTIDGTAQEIQAPPTGLIGAEQALQAGATGAIDSLATGYELGTQNILAPIVTGKQGFHPTE